MRCIRERFISPGFNRMLYTLLMTDTTFKQQDINEGGKVVVLRLKGHPMDREGVRSTELHPPWSRWRCRSPLGTNRIRCSHVVRQDRCPSPNSPPCTGLYPVLVLLFSLLTIPSISFSERGEDRILVNPTHYTLTVVVKRRQVVPHPGHATTNS